MISSEYHGYGTSPIPHICSIFPYIPPSFSCAGEGMQVIGSSTRESGGSREKDES